MDLLQVEEQLRDAYRNVVPRYRRDDELEVQTGHHRRLWVVLRSICLSFPYPITVLDAGCGTGRYFHCLENVERLVGADISPEMLEAAADPVMAEQVHVSRTELVCQNIFGASFPDESFDFIYSLGMFGNGCPVTAAICERFWRWLRPGGKLFFDALSVQDLPLRIRARHTARKLTYPLLPRSLKQRLDERAKRLPLFVITRSELEKIMGSTRFTSISISAQGSGSPLWDGLHLECLAVKA